jgi:hypothetical protein
MRLSFVVDHPSEPEIAKLGVEGGVKQDIARFDVTVQNALLPILVQVHKCRSDSKHDAMPKGITQ